MAAAEEEKWVECGFCCRRNEALEEPKTLPCGHGHCFGCLSDSFDAIHMMKCPLAVCGQVFDVTLASLPSYVMRGGDVVCCDVCVKKGNVNQKADVYCTQCDKKFCTKHLEAFTSAESKQQLFKRVDGYCVDDMEIKGVRTISDCTGLCQASENTCTMFLYVVQPPNPYCLLSWDLGRYCENDAPAYRAVGVCPDSYIYNPHSDACFRLVETPMTWEDANSTCRAANEYLVTFPTAESSRWFREKAIELCSSNSVWNEYLWIGGFYETGDNVYRWKGLLTSVVSSSSSDWAQAEPSQLHEQCMGISLQLSGWLDAGCTEHLPFICERY